MASRFSLSRTHTLASFVLATFSMLIAFVALSGASAEAEVTHKYQSSITEVPAQGPKGEAVAQPGPLSELNSMTVDGKDLYVAEEFGNQESRIDAFDTTTHAFASQFDLPAPPVEKALSGIAVGHVTGSTQIYVGARDEIGGKQLEVVVPFDAEGHQLGQPWTGTPNGPFTGENFEGRLQDVAVDNNSTSLLGDWAAGDVFVDTKSVAFGKSPALNVVDILKPEADGTEEYQGQLTGTCASPGTCPGKIVHFAEPINVTVDSRNGDVLVTDQISLGNNGEPPAASVVDMFRPGPITGEYEFVGSLTGSPKGLFKRINGVSVDSGEGSFAEGAIYVTEAGDVYQFSSSGQYIGQFSGSSQRVASIAVDPTTHDAYLGAAVFGGGQIEIFGSSLVVPDVTTGPASSLAPDSATLNGTVNPDKAESGQTTCQFVWGTSESFGQVLPCPVPVAEGESPAPVSAVLDGLEPDTTYYFRLQAGNANGTNEGVSSQTLHFTTPGPGITKESVSAISSTSATLEAGINPHRASTTYYFEYGTTASYGLDAPAAPGESVEEGEGYNEEARHLQGLSPSTTYHYRVVVVSDLEIEPGVFKETPFYGHDQTFTTQTVGGSLVLPDGRAWEQVSPADKHGAIIPSIEEFHNPGHVIKASESGDAMTYATTTPTEEGASGYAEGEQQIFSKRAPDGGWSSQDIALPHRVATGIAVGAGGEYRMFSEDLSLAIVIPFGEFTSLAPEVTPPDTERTPYLRHDDTCGTQPSSCYLPLLTEAPGYADVPPGVVFDERGNVVDEYVTIVGATPDLSHVLLSSRVALTPGSGGGIYEWSSGKPPAEELQPIEGGSVASLSEDGSHMVLANDGHLYRRDMTGGGTVQLDEVQPGASGAGTPSASFQGENTDGSIVYFTDGQSLTKDSVGGDDDLYECRLDGTTGDKCDLTDIVHTVSGLGVLGASKDTAYVYFASSDVLSNQAGSDGEKAVAGADNLYELHEGVIRLVAIPNQGLSTRVTPDGNYLAFRSDKSLTGYDNAGAEELFLFNSATDRVVCASCNPNGARPEGSSSFPVERSSSFPGKPRYLSSNGQLFFNSTEALVPQDINKNTDVYEYEPVGVGGCSASSVSYNESSGGCVGLISSGTAPGESEFLDASENGDDVFFTTQEKLVATDVDTAVDIYDAHVCSTAAPCSNVVSSPPPCTTADSCRLAPLPQPGIFASPASATFVGAGNLTSKPAAAAKPKSLARAQKLARALKACRREAKRKRAACERKARKQYSSKPAHRARVTKGGRG